jgi:prepilin-type N-terminal cleavage/methylation domain-containing protein
MSVKTANQKAHSRGFTLIEMMVTIAVAAILVSLALPSFGGLMEKFRARRATETMAASMYLAKSEAIKRNTPVRVVFTSSNSGATWCYGLTTGDTCTCTTANSCKLDDAESVVTSTQFKGISLANPATGSVFSFNPLRGTVNAGNVQFKSDKFGYQSRVVLSGFGRVTTCSAAGTGYLGGFKEC